MLRAVNESREGVVRLLRVNHVLQQGVDVHGICVGVVCGGARREVNNVVLA